MKDNAVYALGAGLGRLAAYDFPIHLTEVTTAFFQRTAAVASGQEAADMNALGASAKPDAQAVARL